MTKHKTRHGTNASSKMGQDHENNKNIKGHPLK